MNTEGHMFKNHFKWIFLMVAILAIIGTAHAGTCTTISRPNGNYVSNQVLTASDLNNDFNSIYAPFNSASGAVDGGCIADGTLEKGSFNTTDMELLLNAPKEGCNVTYGDSNTLNVARCRIAVGGNFVKTTTDSSVTWACSGCSSEVADTQYYVYALTTSTGSTLNLSISTTAPNSDGYDSSSNRALARFRNNLASNIDRLTVLNWVGNTWEKDSQGGMVACETPPAGHLGGTWSTNTTYTCLERRVGSHLHAEVEVNTTGAPNSTALQINLPGGRVLDLDQTNTAVNDANQGLCTIRDDGSANYHGIIRRASSTGMEPLSVTVSGSQTVFAQITATAPQTWASGDYVNCIFSVPIEGWDQ